MFLLYFVHRSLGRRGVGKRNSRVARGYFQAGHLDLGDKRPKHPSCSILETGHLPEKNPQQVKATT